jgi:hypothetical protein
MGLIFDSVARHIPVRATVESLGQVFADYPKPDFRVRLWDGTCWSGSENPRLTLFVKHPNALRQMFDAPNELTLGSATSTTNWMSRATLTLPWRWASTCSNKIATAFRRVCPCPVPREKFRSAMANPIGRKWAVIRMQPTPENATGGRSAITTTCLLSSLLFGWASAESTPAPTFKGKSATSIPRNSTSLITCAESCAFVPESVCSTSVAGGAECSCMPRPITVWKLLGLR